MIEKLIDFWTLLGAEFARKYRKCKGKLGVINFIVHPLVILGFLIPWTLVFTILFTLRTLQGCIVYGMPLKEQFEDVKEGLTVGFKRGMKY